MRLKSVVIKNFRSIKELEIPFDSNLRILVGKNEAGKSNILLALSKLDSKSVLSRKDIREPLPDESYDQESYIKFYIAFEDDDRMLLKHELKYKILSSNDNDPIISSSPKKWGIHDIIDCLEGAVYTVDIEAESRYIYIPLPKGEIVEGWNAPSEEAYFDEVIEVNGTPYNLSNLILTNNSELIADYTDSFSAINTKELYKLLRKEVANHVSRNKPDTIFWYYDESNLLPAEIDLEKFKSNPDTCMPLKQMFLLAGITNIGEEIDSAMSRNKNTLRNLLGMVAINATDHLRSVWEENKSVSFGLVPNGSVIDIVIRDSFNQFAPSQRSDGFKRFLTFLLLVSAKVKTNTMVNTLFLVDEPGLGLHPSGERFLRDELIRISNFNYVVYSTHSIFMVDRENTQSNTIVAKDREITLLKSVEESNIIDEEVVWNALGYSVFDELALNNIIFEGWKDKKLFKTAISRVPNRFKDIKKPLKCIGLCHAQGVKHIKSVASILDLANRRYLIVSDADTAAKEKQKEYQGLNYYGLWKRYDELLPGYNIVTAEDFISSKAFLKVIKTLTKRYPSMIPPREDQFPQSNKLDYINQLLRPFITDQEERKQCLRLIKDEVFNNLRLLQIN